MSFNDLVSAISPVIPDNTSVALDIESTDAKEYITIDTTDGSEKLTVAGGGATGMKVDFHVGGGLQGRASNTFSILGTNASATAPNFCPSSGDGDTGIGLAGADQLSLIAGGVEAAQLRSGPEVHLGDYADDAGSNALVLKKSRSATIGTAAIVQDNDVLGVIEFQGADSAGTADANFATGAKIFARVNGTPGDGDMPAELVFATTPDGAEAASERMTILQNGKVGIGAATPTSQLFVSAGNAAVCHFRRADPGTHAGHIEIRSNVEDGVIRAGKTFIIETNNATEALEIDTSQNVGIAMTPGGSHKLDVTGTAGLSTGTAWTNTSDSRIKKDVQDIENALDKINDLRPVSFQYTDEYLSVHAEIDGSKRYNSFIAQEYAQVFPDAVTDAGTLQRVVTPKTDDAPAVKETLLENVLQFTPHDLNMYLVKAVQELTARVTELEAGD